MDFKKLTVEDEKALDGLFDAIEDALPDERYWLPVDAISKVHFFDPAWTDFYGFFDGNRLIAAVALFYNEHEYGESVEQLKMQDKKIAEVGRAMVHPEYRGQGLLCCLIEELIPIAKEKGKQMLLATVHPENLPSQKSFLRAGFTKRLTYVKKSGFTRDIFTYSLE
jgi:RimJ/RimL family protein N-acetyltransferase